MKSTHATLATFTVTLAVALSGAASAQTNSKSYGEPVRTAWSNPRTAIRSTSNKITESYTISGGSINDRLHGMVNSPAFHSPLPLPGYSRGDLIVDFGDPTNNYADKPLLVPALAFPIQPVTWGGAHLSAVEPAFGPSGVNTFMPLYGDGVMWSTKSPHWSLW